MKPLKALFPFLHQHAFEFVVGFLFMLLQNYSFMKTPIYMQRALDEITSQNRWELLRSDLLMIGLYTVLTVICMFFMRKLMIGASRKIEYKLREKLYHKLLALDMPFFLKNETGDLVSRCTNDLGDVRQLLGPGLMYVPNALSRFVLFVPILVNLSRQLMTVVTILIVVIVTIVVVLMPRVRVMYKRIQETVGKINSRVWQVLSGITTIKLYTLEDIETERFKALNSEYIRRYLAVARYRGTLFPLIIFLFAVTELVILRIGGQQVIQQQMTIGQLLQFNVMMTQLTFPILSLGWVLSLIQQGISAMGRINYILNAPVERRDDWQPLETNDLTLTARHLSYHYPEHQEQVLRNVHFTIKPGKVIGITGTIGSGKTTLLNLLTGVLKPERGMLFINDTDICDIRPEQLFEKISVVPQVTFLFSRSITENIALGTDRPINLEAIQEVVRRAGLERDVLTFPDKYEQIIGERGITLSGGQKQRTAIARALRKRSPVLVFDDALSSVDAQTEAEILEHLESIGDFQTLIIVSHRISALRNADAIYVLDHGQIVEYGTHAELLQNNHLYARLAKLQQMDVELQELHIGKNKNCPEPGITYRKE